MKRYYAAGLATVIFWGSSYFATAVAYRTIAPLQLGLVRALISAALFFVYMPIAGIRERPRKRDLPLFAVTGMFGVTLYFACQNLGLAYTSSSNAAFVIAAIPATVLVMECLWRRRLPSLRQALGIVVAVGGIVTLTGASGGGGSNDLLGTALLLLAGVMWGFYNITAQRISSRYSVPTLTAWQMVFGALFFVPLTFAEGRAWVMPTPESAAAILFLAVCCSLVSFLCYNYALVGLSATVAASLQNLQPIVGIVCSGLILGETVTARQLIGGTVTIAGVLLTTTGGKRA